MRDGGERYISGARTGLWQVHGRFASPVFPCRDKRTTKMIFYFVSPDVHEALLGSEVTSMRLRRPDIVCYWPTHPEVLLYAQHVPDPDPVDFEKLFKVLDESSDPANVRAIQRSPYMYVMKEEMSEATGETIFRDMIAAAPEFFSFETNHYFGFTMAKGVPIDDIALENPIVQLITIGDTALPGTEGNIPLQAFLQLLG